MSIPNEFNDIIAKQLNVQAAWLPVTNNFALGDYGVFSDGVFVKMGNIKEYNITFDQKEAPEASIDFTSAETSVVQFAAGVQVDVIPAGAVDAKITLKFGKEGSFMVKAPTITVVGIENVNQVARQLKAADGWKRKWKVVHQTYKAIDAAIISTIAKNTDVTFSGDVKALKEFKFGSLGLTVSTTKQLGLEIHGKAGVIGLGLFKLKAIGGGADVLGLVEEQVEYVVSPEQDL